MLHRSLSSSLSYPIQATLLLASLTLCCGGDQPHSGVGDDTLGLVADSAMVVSAHPLATRVGVHVLRIGGNAVDAAVAVHWALAVVAPWAGNIGGGGLMVVRDDDGTVRTLDFREKAPSTAYREMFLDANGVPIPNLSMLGHKATGVPGSVAGLFAIHDSLGRLPMERLMQPAIDLAMEGFPLTALEARDLNRHLPTINNVNTLPNAYTERELWHQGDTLHLLDLAHTLERIRDDGPKGFYAGTTAALIVDEMNRGGGLISAADLAAYTPAWRAPARGMYRDVEIISMGPPSSGGMVLLQALKGIAPMDVKASGWQSTATVHRMVEVERRAFADRATHLGDPDFVKIPFDELITDAYVARRMIDFDPNKATPSAQVHAGAPGIESDHTTHFSIVDAEGNAVSCTTTLNGWYGSGVVVGGAGFLLNNEMDDFSASPNAPNHRGLLGGDANAIAPNKRMLSSMAPTIVTRKGELFMVLGTPGGSTIPTAVFQTLLNVIDHGMGAQQAVTAPRFHHQWYPDTIRAEAHAIAPADSLELVRMGHAFKKISHIGRVDAILILPDGRMEAGADPRGDDSAGGY